MATSCQYTLKSYLTDSASARGETLTDISLCHDTISDHCGLNICFVDRYRRLEDRLNARTICRFDGTVGQRRGTRASIDRLHQVSGSLSLFIDSNIGDLDIVLVRGQRAIHLGASGVIIPVRSELLIDLFERTA